MKKLFLLLLFCLMFVFQVLSQSRFIEPTLTWTVSKKKVVESWISPNGQVILIISDRNKNLFKYDMNSRTKGAVEFVNATNGETLSKFIVCNGQKFGFGSFSNDGALWAVTCANGSAELWDVKQKKLEDTFAPSRGVEIDKVYLSPNGKKLLTFESFEGISSSYVSLWNVETSELIKNLDPLFTVGSKSANLQAVFNSDSSIVAVSYNADVYFWDTDKGNILKKLVDNKLGNLGLTHKSLVYTIKFSSNDKKIVTGSHDSQFKVWEVKTGKLERVFLGHKRKAGDAVFNFAGNFLATSDLAKQVKLWEVKTGKLIWTTKLKRSAYHLKFSPDGKKLYASTFDMRPFLIDVETGKADWKGKGWWQIDNNGKNLITFNKKKKKLQLYNLD